MFREAFKFLPDGTYVHKQDVFLKERYCPDIGGGSFLDRPMRGISGDDCMSAIPASCTLYFRDSKVLRRPTYCLLYTSRCV